MKQRNETGETQHVSVWRSEEHPDWEPFAVGDGEEIDFPVQIGSLTPVEDEKPKPKRKDAAVAADKKEGEPQ